MLNHLSSETDSVCYCMCVCLSCEISWSTFKRVVWCKTDGEREDRGPNGDFGIEGNSSSDGKGELSEMVWACVEEWELERLLLEWGKSGQCHLWG